jgi:tRNA 5-methylaminomethyl-2-thiouridine biosynthesis bifunctional protein
MPSPSLAILGAGLAGLSLAEALIHQGFPATDLLIVDPIRPGAGASGIPGALVHPLPGRSLRPKPGYGEAFAFTCTWLQQWPQHLWRTTQVLRLAPNPEGRERMAQSLAQARSESPDHPLLAQVQTLDAATLQVLWPGLTAEQAFAVPARTVHLKALITHLSTHLKQQGVTFITPEHLAVNTTPGGWALTTPQGRETVAQLVLTPGIALNTWFPQLRLSQVHGEVQILHQPAWNGVEIALSGSGHLAPLPDGSWVAGATFYRAEQPGSAAEARTWIGHRLGHLVPHWESAQEQQIWHGQRAVIVPDREPVAGAVPGYPNLWVLSGLAARGLLWGPLLAHHMAHSLMGETVVWPAAVRPERLPPQSWELASIGW